MQDRTVTDRVVIAIGAFIMKVILYAFGIAATIIDVFKKER